MRAIALIPAVLTMLSLTGCMSAETREWLRKSEAQAAVNAAEYISEKYGFEPEVTNVAVDYHSSMFGSWSYTDNAFVQVKGGGRDFTVYISCKEDFTGGRDSYQSQEITEALKAELDGIVEADSRRFMLYTERGMFEGRAVYDIDGYLLLTDIYYDGDNLAEVLDNNTICSAAYVAADLSLVDGEALAELTNGCSAKLFSYIDEESYSHGKETGLIEELTYGIYLKEYAEIDSKGEYSYTKHTTKRCGELYYLSDHGEEFTEAQAECSYIKPEELASRMYYIPKIPEETAVWFRKSDLPEDWENCDIVLAFGAEEGEQLRTGYTITWEAGEYIGAVIYPHQTECYLAVRYH